MRRFSASASASTMTAGLLGLGRCFHRRAPLRLDALGLGQGGLGHGPVLRFLHGGLGFALAGLAQLIGFGLLDLQVRLGAGDLGLRFRFAADRLGVGVGDGDTHLALGILDLRLAFQGRRLLADLLLLVELSHTHGLVAHAPRGCRSP